MTGLLCLSFCSAELPGRPWGPNCFLRKSLFFFTPWWSWYVLGPHHPNPRCQPLRQRSRNPPAAMPAGEAHWHAFVPAEVPETASPGPSAKAEAAVMATCPALGKPSRAASHRGHCRRQGHAPHCCRSMSPVKAVKLARQTRSPAVQLARRTRSQALELRWPRFLVAFVGTLVGSRA